MIAAVVVQQAVASVAGLELRPAVSAYDMYSTTFRSPAAFDRANVTACKANLRDIGSGLLEYKGKYNKVPPHSGVRFFASLVSDKVWEATEATAIKLTCPGVETGALLGIADLPEEEWFADVEVLDGSYSSYAGRDVKDHPLRKFPASGKEGMQVANRARCRRNRPGPAGR